MEKIRFALVGCGGMGTRHIHGLRELAQTPFCNMELAALCDINPDNLAMAAAAAEKELGVRPPTFTDLAQMAAEVGDLVAVDVVTDPSVHHNVVCQALELGLHVLVEKPLAITVGACRKIVAAAEASGRILSVAENFRRDPSARLVRHLIAKGAIGEPYMALFHSLGAGNPVFITPWRHQRQRGGFILDMAVHFTHMIRYQLGDIAQVAGDARLVEPVRVKADSMSMQYAFYQQRFKAMEQEVRAEAEDTTQAIFTMESGATLNWIVGISGHGSTNRQLILGPEGSIEGFGDRGGRISLSRRGQAPLDQEALLAAQEGLALDELTCHLFPSGVSDADTLVDLKLIAYELHELGQAIMTDGPVEVDATCGMKDVAALYAVFESARAGRSVTMAEVESGQVYAYQAEIDAALEL